MSFNFNSMKKFAIVYFLLASWMSFQTLPARPPKMPKPKKNEWIEPVRKVAPQSIYGNWTWLNTDCCGSRHGITTPESTGDNIALELNANNTFVESHTKKNPLPRSGTIILFKENAQDVMQFNDERPARYYLSDNGDTLTLSWKHLELQTEKYLRKK